VHPQTGVARLQECCAVLPAGYVGLVTVCGAAATGGTAAAPGVQDAAMHRLLLAYAYFNKTYVQANDHISLYAGKMTPADGSCHEARRQAFLRTCKWRGRELPAPHPLRVYTTGHTLK
jgi:hypothetical protein